MLEALKRSETLRESDAIVGLYKDFIKLKNRLRRDGSAIQAYLDRHPVRRLHLGSGPHRIPGWLCTDVNVEGRGAVYLNAAEPFPLAEGTFDYICSEHMIEHIPWKKGLQMLNECRRVLKPGGVARIGTPDLAVLVRVYRREGGDFADSYVKYMTDHFLPGVKTYQPIFALNCAFTNFGHQFLYDAELLSSAMAEAGFINITRCVPGQSHHPDLCNIEKHGLQVTEEINRFETMVFKARHPELAS